MTLVPIWATFGVSWNILSGYGGQLSFGHASLFGIGRLCRHLSFGLLEHHPLAWDHLPERGAIDVLAPDQPRLWRDIWSAGHSVSSVAGSLPVEALIGSVAEEYGAASRTEACRRGTRKSTLIV
jgi:ABC-type branched-subunit amino acid transport system permease subunit